jgi:hypothetical protein
VYGDGPSFKIAAFSYVLDNFSPGPSTWATIKDDTGAKIGVAPVWPHHLPKGVQPLVISPVSFTDDEKNDRAAYARMSPDRYYESAATAFFSSPRAPPGLLKGQLFIDAIRVERGTEAWSDERLFLIWVAGHPDCINVNVKNLRVTDELYANVSPSSLPNNGTSSLHNFVSAVYVTDAESGETHDLEDGKPGWTELNIRADMVRHLLEPVENHRLRNHLSPDQHVGIADLAQFCHAYQAARCMLGTDPHGACKRGKVGKRLCVHRCVTCAGAHPACFCPYGVRHPADQRCPCPMPCLPNMCLKGDVDITWS